MTLFALSLAMFLFCTGIYRKPGPIKPLPASVSMPVLIAAISRWRKDSPCVRIDVASLESH